MARIKGSSSGSIFPIRGGYGVRWPEDGRRPQKTGFRTKTEAQRWFDEEVAPRLRRGAPSGEISFDAFCDLFLERHGARNDITERTIKTIRQRLAHARSHFGDWTLRELEGAADDIAAWRATQPESGQQRRMAVLRQVLTAAVNWRYLAYNPAIEAGRNPAPGRPEVDPFTRAEIEAIVAELRRFDAAIVVLAAETGLRTNEWVPLERRDIDRSGPALHVLRRYADGVLTPYPKTRKARRRVPLTARASEAIESLPPRIDTPLLFPAERGGYINLANWRTRVWYPALEAAGVRKRGPYHLRHTFATEALAGHMPGFQLQRVMGCSGQTIEHHYGHLAHDAEDDIRRLLDARAEQSGVYLASEEDAE
jgi:integrase